MEYLRALVGSGKLEKLVDKVKQKAGEKRKGWMLGRRKVSVVGI